MDRLRALWITALGPGMRQGELLGLRWEDVDLEAGRLRVRHTLGRVDGKLTLLEPKTERSRRTVVLPTEVAADKVEAHYHDGVLELKLPKTEASTAKTIAAVLIDQAFRR